MINEQLEAKCRARFEEYLAKRAIAVTAVEKEILFSFWLDGMGFGLERAREQLRELCPPLRTQA